MMSLPIRALAPTLLCTALLMLPAVAPADTGPVSRPATGEAIQPTISLPEKPSQMLRAPQSSWEPVWKQADAVLDERASRASTLGDPALVELAVYRTVLAQSRKDWQAALDGVKKTRQLQDSESGRQTAGLLNEVLARQALGGKDAAWLRQHVRDQVLAMPWKDVEPTLRYLREQLAASKPESIEAFVVNRLDLAAGIGGNAGTIGFIMQLLGARFQLLEVLPQREALLAGLDEAFAQRVESK